MANGDITEIGLLTSIELPSEASIPEIVRMVRNLVPCLSAAFIWASPEGTAENYFTWEPAFNYAAKVYYSDFYNSREIAAGLPGFSKLMLSGKKIFNSAWIGEQYENSEFVRDVLALGGTKHMLLGVLRDSKDKGVGMFVLSRLAADQPFSLENERMLETILDAARGANFDRRWNQEFSSAPQLIGSITFNQEGRIAGLTASGDTLLRLLLCPDLSPDNATDWIGVRLLDLCPSHGVVQSEAVRRNRWGQFRLSCEPVWAPQAAPDAQRNGDRLTLVTIQQFAPLGLLTYHQIRKLGIPPQQRRVVWLLSQGLTAREIASLMGLSVSTVQTHITRAYQALNISSQKDLLTLLHAS